MDDIHRSLPAAAILAQGLIPICCFLSSLPKSPVFVLLAGGMDEYKRGSFLGRSFVDELPPAHVAPLAHRTPPQLNYTGASVFISYIIAALIMTVVCLRLIQQRLHANISGLSAAQWSKARFFASCAFFSFSVLSYNMLSFLIESYLAWADAADTGHLRGYGPLADIWQWTTTSSLFLDFARSLGASAESYYWSMQALIATLITNILINVTARIHGNVKTLPFVMLAQILPISFSLTLFFVYLLVGHQPPIPMKPRLETAMLKTDRRRVQPGRWTELAGVVEIVALIIGYSAIIHRLPLFADDVDFILFVLLTRVLLVFGYAMPLPASYSIRYSLLMSPLCLAFSVGWFMYLGTVPPMTMRFNKAAQTLQWDYGIWLFSTLVWAFCDVNSAEAGMKERKRTK